MEYCIHLGKDCIKPCGLAHDKQSLVTLTKTNTDRNFRIRSNVPEQKYLEDNVKILDKRSLNVFVRKTNKVKCLRILDLKQPGEAFVLNNVNMICELFESALFIKDFTYYR